MQTVDEGERKPLPPSEPIPPGFGPATPPWVWKLAYTLLGVVIATLTMTGAIILIDKAAVKERQCLDPPPGARAWAYPNVVSNGTSRPFVCARKADNNKGVIPHSHRCLRMVPCEDKR